MSAAMPPRARRAARNVHVQLEEEAHRKAELLASKQTCKRQFAAANAEFQKEMRMEKRLVKKAAKYDLDTFVKICGKKLDLPFIVCSRCNCPIDSRRAIRKAVDEVAAGRAVNVQDAGLPLLGDAATQEAAEFDAPPPLASEQRLAAGRDPVD